MATGHRRLIGLYLELTKARLSALVVVTTAVGFVMATPARAGLDWLTLMFTVVGTALAAGGANALNQLVETRRDGLMKRTRDRPLPSGAMGAAHGFIFAMLLCYAGLGVLAVLVNLPAAGLALATIVIYVAAYTPLKTRTTLNTLVGAVCGAIPPLIGWVAAAGRLDAAAWVLAGLLFVWQIPHFFALAWLYRDDYARGGHAMLPVLDATGRITGRVVVVTSLCLIPLALCGTLFGLAGPAYALGSLALGVWFVGMGARLCATRTEASARRVFLASIIYLPAVLGLMVVDRRAPVTPMGARAAVTSTAAAAAPTPGGMTGLLNRSDEP